MLYSKGVRENAGLFKAHNEQNVPPNRAVLNRPPYLLWGVLGACPGSLATKDLGSHLVMILNLPAFLAREVF